MDIAKANNSIANPVTFLLGKAENIDIPDSSFDKIVFHRVFQHLLNYESVLTESSRTLKAGGIIHIAEPDYLSATFFSENIDFERKLINIIVKERIPNSYKVRTIPQVLKQIGFNSLNIEVHNYIFNSFQSANHLINFDKNVVREFQTGRFSQSDLETWNKIKSLDINCFNFSFNMILVTAQKPL